MGYKGGPPNFIFTPNLIFLRLKTPCKILETYDNTFWEKSNAGGKKEEREEKNAVNSGHLVPWQRTQAARTKITINWFMNSQNIIL